MPQVCPATNVFDFALRRELDSELYYRQIAAIVKYEELEVILEGLAEDEQRHYEIVRMLKKQSPEYLKINSDLEKITVARGMDRGNECLSIDQNTIASERDEQMDLYRAALHKEEQSVQLYKKLKAATDQQAQKDIIAGLIQEEERHVEVLGNIIMYCTGKCRSLKGT